MKISDGFALLLIATASRSISAAPTKPTNVDVSPNVLAGSRTSTSTWPSDRPPWDGIESFLTCFQKRGEAAAAVQYWDIDKNEKRGEAAAAVQYWDAEEKREIAAPAAVQYWNLEEKAWKLVYLCCGTSEYLPGYPGVPSLLELAN